MCWASSNTPIIKVAKEPITVFKVVEVHNGKVISSIMGYEYEIGKEYNLQKELEIVRTNVSRWRIAEGFHSYTHDSVNNNINGYWETPNEIVDREVTIFNKHHFMKCIIPIGSKYYLNEFGEVISDSIIPVGIYPVSKTTEEMRIIDIPYTNKVTEHNFNWFCCCIKNLFFGE